MIGRVSMYVKNENAAFYRKGGFRKDQVSINEYTEERESLM